MLDKLHELRNDMIAIIENPETPIREKVRALKKSEIIRKAIVKMEGYDNQMKALLFDTLKKIEK